MLLGLLAAVQVAGWTAQPVAPYVGDTVRLTRVVAVPPRATVRAEPLVATDDLIPLGPPQVIPRADGVLIRYHVALFRTGPVTVRLPGLQLIHPETGADGVPPDSLVVQVASVLPPAVPPDSVAPRASTAPLARPWQRPLLLAVPVLVALLVVILWAVWRRRRARHGVAPVSATPDLPPLTGRWLGAGEVRVSAAWGIARLRQAVRERIPDAHDGLDLRTWRAVVGVHRPDWPLRKLDEVLERLDRARFAPLGGADVAELLVEVDELVAEVARGDEEHMEHMEDPGGDGDRTEAAERQGVT